MRRGIIVALALLLCASVAQAQLSYSGAAGASTVFAADSATTAAATSGTVDEILHTVTLPANSLLASGDFTTLETVFATAANGNTKIIRQYKTNLGGTILAGLSTTGNNSRLTFTTVIRRTSASTALVSTWYTWTGGNVPANAGNGQILTGLDFTAPIVFVSAAATVTAAGDATALSTTLLVTRF